jgi:hypothetical protein
MFIDYLVRTSKRWRAETARPRSVAAFRLMTSSNVPGCNPREARKQGHAAALGHIDAVDAGPQLRRFGAAVSQAEQQFITTIATTNAGLRAQARHLVEVYGENDDPFLLKLITTL